MTKWRLGQRIGRESLRSGQRAPILAHVFGFLIKKAFFDWWDAFLPATVVNLGFVLVLLVPSLLPSAVVGFGAVAAYAVFVPSVLLVFVYLGGVSAVAHEIAEYRSVSWSAFAGGVRASIPVALSFGGIAIVHVALLIVAVPVYVIELGGMVGMLALSILFWISLAWFLAALFIFPASRRLAARPRTALSRAFMFALDNPLFAFATAIVGVVMMVASVFTALLIPGIVGLFVLLEDAMKLRMYRYDWLRENPTGKRRDVPWDELLYDDRDRIGKRSLRGMIFPWKD